ncbi:hypothetical protein [Paenibacillus qinlingensis]|uniref:hypothetical protein n=1 Tax=Paenibacillus qinlingensis TaxID=1837343 RepID=UPI0015657769|nr:hypothetical protein [Paenibacillus qinlingensis]NQX61323.1 hypothetical protein [Paenibacillus qinlingensis]
MFEKEYEIFWNEQVRQAQGQRLDMLRRDLTGTKKLLEEVVLPVLGTVEGLELEFEMISLSGVKIYGDVCHPKLRIVFEEESFVTHAEKITRDRFSFERARARSVAMLGYTYFPYSRDQLEKKASFCQRNLYEWIGRFGNAQGAGMLELPVYEREVLRFALLCNKPFQLKEVSQWLQLKREACGKIVRKLEAKGFILPIGGGLARSHKFMFTEKAVALLHGRN